MSFRALFFWLIVAGALLAAIILQQRLKKPSAGPTGILPQFKAASVNSVQVRPAGQAEIRAVRTNGSWSLQQPLTAPAESDFIEALLIVLERLAPAAFIPEQEISDRFNADEAYGFSDPQASIVLVQDQHRTHLRVGRRTAPGDQVFVQVVGRQGAYVLDADFLKVLPRHANDWRARALVDFPVVAVDRLLVTNAPRFFELQRGATNEPWRMTRPIRARASNERIVSALARLSDLRIQQFVSDDPNPDLDRYGLQAPELELVFAEGTNGLAHLQFGKTATNGAPVVFARRAGERSIVTVPADVLAPWRVSINGFRDSHLFNAAETVGAIQVLGESAFGLSRSNNGTWTLFAGTNFAVPMPYRADPVLVREFLAILAGLEVVEFSKDVVTDQDLPSFGLAVPSREYVLAHPALNSGSFASNSVVCHLKFGRPANQHDKVYVRRTDETAVYAVSTNDFQRLPAAPWQLRERKLWPFTEEEVITITIKQQDRTRRILRRGPHQWSLAPGSQGIINDLAVEETVKGLARLEVVNWAAVGAEHRPAFGFRDDGHEIALEFKNGQKAAIQFGGAAAGNMAYAAVTLEDQLWIFEFPWLLFRDVTAYLSAPKGL